MILLCAGLKQLPEGCVVVSLEIDLPFTTRRHPEVRKRASVFGPPFAPGFGVNGQSLRVGPRDLVLSFCTTYLGAETRPSDLLLIATEIPKW